MIWNPSGTRSLEVTQVELNKLKAIKFYYPADTVVKVGKQKVKLEIGKILFDRPEQKGELALGD